MFFFWSFFLLFILLSFPSCHSLIYFSLLQVHYGAQAAPEERTLLLGLPLVLAALKELLVPPSLPTPVTLALLARTQLARREHPSAETVLLDSTLELEAPLFAATAPPTRPPLILNLQAARNALLALILMERLA